MSFSEFLKKINIQDENLENKNIDIAKVSLDDKNMELTLILNLFEHLSQKESDLLKRSIDKYFIGIKVQIVFNEEFLKYKDEYELIRSEILTYNPSSTVWIDELKININKEFKNIEIITPNESVYFSVLQNGLKDILETKLKCFNEYEITFKEPKDNIKSKERIIETFVNNYESEEKKMCKETEVVREVIKDVNQTSSDLDCNYSYGRKDIGQIINISDLNLNISKATIKADIFNIDKRELKDSSKYLVIFSVTDYTSSYIAKLFISSKKIDELLDNIKVGDNVIITGNIQYDNYSKAENIMVKYIEKSEKIIRKDKSSEKRVELKLHSKMSTMSGVSSFDDLAKRAKYWGMNTIAITDTADVQGFPEAMEAGSKYNLKILYGLDANFVDDKEKILKNYFKDDTDKDTFVVFDIETTGFSARTDEITEIGAVKIKDGIIIDRYSQLVNPVIPIPQVVVELTGISNAFVANEPTIDLVIPEFYEFCKDSILVAHNANFDMSFIKRDMRKYGFNHKFPVLDTLSLARAVVKDTKRFNLGTLSKKLGVTLVNAHRAVNDAEATAEVFLKMLELAKEEGIEDIGDINLLCNKIDSSALFEGSVSILVKNEIGLKNLYKLVSESHMNYFNRFAKVPRSLLDKYKEGLLVGSGNSSSELYKAVFNLEDDEVIKEIVKYYDYIEIQPVENNLNFIANNMVDNYDVLKEINIKLYNIGKELNIPVVATGDVFYLDEKDDILRRIILNGQTGRPPENAKIPQSLYFRTTEEMLEEFSYLGEDQAYEVVVENTNLISSMCEDIKPIPDGTFSPVIEGSEKDLRDMCYSKAHLIYGEKLPKIVEERLERELNSIINHGYAVLYIIAQKLVKKSNDDGYLVGSRGSVGSSFAATMSSITEVNPLPPHYVCGNCKYSEFIDDPSVGSGVDLLDKECPICGTKLTKDGHNIPFEVFLGFDGDKEPDIDLNFAGEYQPVAHKYTEELFGEGYVFRAGTIGTVAEKTAFGFVKKYFEDKFIPNVEIERLAKACIGVKRTTGQHPGGVMICPREKDIFDFTPIQYPADDKNSGVITTHFDYNFIHGKILKLDILGHDGPSIIKMLEDFTGINSQEIPLDDSETITLFSNADALNLNEDIFSTETGTLGIPEFGTGFVKQMLIETKPKNFAELVRISGLSHGTDVWTNNAQELVKAGKAELSTVISTREDIMLYLIQAGADNKMAFDTMEKVRKGKGLTDEQKEIMKNLDLPPWYIDSCEKIKYMFPKAHAVAYVMLSFRIAYFKLNYPLAYYATFFTIKLADFDGELIMKGISAVKEKISEIKSMNEKLTAKDKGQINVLEVVLEMFARGYEFEPVNIYESETSKFTIKNSKVQMPLRALMGLGESVAQNIVAERQKGKFLSIEDLVSRTKATKTVVSILEENKLLSNLPKSNQLSLFNI
ncbi:PolC-type DNA polymerase III [Anaerosphaera multitolerans]|uniref:PolC-type DNA polymerase III n=1 Tax=Anaerosphaera multitolerans TaxID=2487351 RepID=UPI003B847032